MGKTQAEFPGRSKLWLGKHSWDKDSRWKRSAYLSARSLADNEGPSDAAGSLLSDT
jgi:hypothetical protein